MNCGDHMTMEEKILDLKNKLRDYDTEDILGIISLSYSTFADSEGVIDNRFFAIDTTLMSPQRQRMYLAGLLMSTEYNGKPSVHDENLQNYKNIEDDIQSITSDYIKGFMLYGKETLNPSNDTAKNGIKKSLVSMQAFISYFDTGDMRYEEQIVDLIHTLYDPFDRELTNLTGLCVDDYVRFYEFAKKNISSRFEEANAAQDKIRNFLDEIQLEIEKSTSEEEAQFAFSKLQNYGTDHPDEIKFIQDGLTGFNKISKNEIIAEFGSEKGEKFLDNFSLKREERDFQYYNQKNPFVEKPLCWLGEEKLFLVSPALLLSAIYDYITCTIEDDKNDFNAKYTKKKADIVEEEFLKCFCDIFEEKASYHKSVCEIMGSMEHDILIETGNTIIIAEVKASKVHEPFYNPEKAYTRIERHFFSSNGIGYAYNQAINLKKHIEQSESITLYEDMKIPFVIGELEEKEIIPLVLTLNQFGGIAINTSLLLTPEAGQPYPWVCNLHDFQNLIVMMKYLHKGTDDFLSYINWRIRVHEKIIAGDELDIAEFFFTSPKYINEKDFIYIHNNIQNCLIDKIYYEKHGLTMPNYSQSYVSESITSSLPTRKAKKIYPNEPCPCGSGKKYKKCHGKS